MRWDAAEGLETSNTSPAIINASISFSGFLSIANQERLHVLWYGHNQKMSVLNANQRYVVYVSYHYLYITADKNSTNAKIMLYLTAFLPIIMYLCIYIKNKFLMKILYYIYQICIALPILLVLTILTAIVTIIGSLLGGAHFGDIIQAKYGRS